MSKELEYLEFLEQFIKLGFACSRLEKELNETFNKQYPIIKQALNQYQPYGYEYNGQFYFNDDDVDRAIADKLSEQGYNNADVPSEHIMEEWDNVTELYERVEE